jgi:CRISPR/Cas system-associated exonuclease Cas4 (RecB family)
MLDNFYKKNFKTADSFAGFWKFRWKTAISGEFLKGKQKQNLETRVIDLKLKSEDVIPIKIGNHIRFPEEDSEALGLYFGYRNLGMGLLKKFYNRHKPQPEPSEREKRFDINFKGHLLTGFWDRIDEHNGELFITDYKTDKSSPEKSSFLLDRYPQFTIYSLAFRDIFGKKEKNILFYHLRSGKVFKTERSQKDFDYLEKLCDDLSEGVSKEHFLPRYGFNCHFCDYQTPCAKYNVGSQGPEIDLSIKNPDIPQEWLSWSLEDDR